MIRESLLGFHRDILLGFEPLNFADASEHGGQPLTGHYHDAVTVGDYHITGGQRHTSDRDVSSLYYFLRGRTIG